MIDKLAEVVACKCFVQGENRANAVWLCQDVVQDLRKVPNDTLRTLTRHFTFYADHGLKVFRPPNYVAYEEKQSNGHSMILGRFRAKNLRAYGFEWQIEDWTIFIITKIDPNKKRPKTNPRLLRSAEDRGWEIIEGLENNG